MSTQSHLNRGASSMRTNRSSSLNKGSSIKPSGTSRASNLGSGLAASRYSVASHYSNTNATPLNREVVGVPMSTLTATGLAAVFYVIAIITILAADCPFSREVIYFFTFLLVALLALSAMAGINMVFTRYRFNCLSLSISLLYSGSCALIILGLIESAAHGLCRPAVGSTEPPVTTTETTSADGSTTTTGNGSSTELPFTARAGLIDADEIYGLTTRVYHLAAATVKDKSGGLFSSGYWPNYLIWIITGIGLCFQLVAHYYYG